MNDNSWWQHVHVSSQTNSGALFFNKVLLDGGRCWTADSRVQDDYKYQIGIRNSKTSFNGRKTLSGNMEAMGNSVERLKQTSTWAQCIGKTGSNKPQAWEEHYTSCTNKNVTRWSCKYNNCHWQMFESICWNPHWCWKIWLHVSAPAFKESFPTGREESSDSSAIYPVVLCTGPVKVPITRNRENTLAGTPLRGSV